MNSDPGAIKNHWSPTCAFRPPEQHFSTGVKSIHISW